MEDSRPRAESGEDVILVLGVESEEIEDMDIE